MSQLIINSKEINDYVNDYLQMMDDRNKNKKIKIEKKQSKITIARNNGELNVL